MTALRLDARLRDHVARYAWSHQHPVNQALHAVGIPLLAVAALGLLARVAWPGGGAAGRRPNLGHAALVGAALWYLRSGLGGGLTLAGVAACYRAGAALPAGRLVAALGAGAVLHGVGHYAFERKPPALLSRPVAVLEAPAWLLAAAAGWDAGPPRQS